MRLEVFMSATASVGVCDAKGWEILGDAGREMRDGRNNP
jgi:hypothetical protein